MVDRKKKEGKIEIQKIKYLQNENSFLDEIKNIFHLGKNENCLKIADTSFKGK